MSMLEPIEGLLGQPGRRTRRRREAFVWALFAVASVWVVVVGVRSTLAPAVEEEGAFQWPTDRLLPLQAPALAAVEDDPWAEVDESAGSVRSRRSRIEGEIERNQTVLAALRAAGLDRAVIHPAVSAMGDVFDFRRSRPGDTFLVELDAEGRIRSFRYQRSPEHVYLAERQEDDTWTAGRARLDLTTEVRTLAGRLEGSLGESLIAQGERAALANTLAQVFQWDIDFSRDPRPGDAFRIAYEVVSLDGEFLRYGRVLAASYEGQRVQRSAFWFEEGDDGEGAYYDAEGRPLERMFLAAPLRYRRISSRFNPNRMHPVLNRPRPHLGVDYAAPTGTPIWASAGGTVSFAGMRGAYGNLIILRHAQGYETWYAHLHRIERGVRAGARVRQGQTIGYVGTTGLSTGPHLHYELRRNGRAIDPLAHQDARLPPLSGRALQDFRRSRDALLARLEDEVLPVPSESLLAEARAIDDAEAEEEDEDLKGEDWGP